MSVKDGGSDTVPARSLFGRTYWIMAGTILIFAGFVALLIPLIPTTPFLILGAACYAKSSLRFYGLLKDSPLSGDYVRSYEGRTPLPTGVLVLTILPVWLAVAFTSIFLVRETYLQAILAAVAVAETIILPLWNRKSSKLNA